MDTKNNTVNALLLEYLRPGQTVEDYAVTITRNSNDFVGLADTHVKLTIECVGNPIGFNMEDSEIYND